MTTSIIAASITRRHPDELIDPNLSCQTSPLVKFQQHNRVDYGSLQRGAKTWKIVDSIQTCVHISQNIIAMRVEYGGFPYY